MAVLINIEITILTPITPNGPCCGSPAVDYEALEEIYREWLARFSRVLPGQSPSLVKTEQALATVLERTGSRLLRTGDAVAAVPAFREALDLLCETEQEQSESTAKLRSELAASLIALNWFGEAEKLLLDAIPVIEKERGTNNAATQVARNRLANLYAAWKRPDDSKRVRALLPEIFVEAAWDLGPLRYDGTVAVEGGSYSGFLDRKSVWIFGETATSRPGSDGSTLRQATIAWTDKLDAGKGLALIDGLKDRAGVPIDVLPLTKEDAMFNAAHSFVTRKRCSSFLRNRARIDIIVPKKVLGSCI